MRAAIVLTVFLGTAAVLSSQERPRVAEEIPPRFGIPHRGKTYSQATPKLALESVLAVAERGDTKYLVAHLLDPVFVDTRIADRGKQFEPTVLEELNRLKDFQKRNPDQGSSDSLIPTDPVKFQARLVADSRLRAFNQLTGDVKAKLIDDPEVLKDLRRFARSGSFPEGGGDTAKVGLPDVKDRAVFLKKIGDRWYMENRQTDEKAPSPPASPEPKKE